MENSSTIPLDVLVLSTVGKKVVPCVVPEILSVSSRRIVFRVTNVCMLIM